MCSVWDACTPATSSTCAGELQESVFMVPHPRCRPFSSERAAFCTSLVVFLWCKRRTPTSGKHVHITIIVFWPFFFSKDDVSGSNSAVMLVGGREEHQSLKWFVVLECREARLVKSLPTKHHATTGAAVPPAGIRTARYSWHYLYLQSWRR